MAPITLRRVVSKVSRTTSEAWGHLRGRLSGQYYWEDFVRVYPNGVYLDSRGKPAPAPPVLEKIFLSHKRVYQFAAQFARGAAVADIGCGTGYGCALLKDAGAREVCGMDASTHAIEFARSHFADKADFSVQGITDMKLYADQRFDLTLNSEVLEHIKEYGKQDRAVEELKRITRPGGIVIIGTPNSELLGDHGFWFDEMDALMKKHFSTYCIFENALLPFGPARAQWEQRRRAGRTGVVVTQAFAPADLVHPESETPELKQGLAPGRYRLGELEIDTRLLLNSHSWMVVAIRDRA